MIEIFLDWLNWYNIGIGINKVEKDKVNSKNSCYCRKK